MANNKKITIVLSDANAWDLNVVSMILNKPIAEIVSHCLTRFNQPCHGCKKRFSASKVQPT